MTEHDSARPPERQIEEVDLQALIQDIIGNSEWHKSTMENQDVERRVTWAHYPFRFVMTQFGRESGRLRKKIAPTSSIVESISAKREDTGLHELRRYYIVDGMCRAMTYNELPPIEDISEEEAQGLASDLDFVITNHLYGVDEMDKFELEQILKQARLDGTENYA